MALSVLPNEIFVQILRSLSFHDQKSCMQVDLEWHSRFQPWVLQCMHIKTTKHFKEFLRLLKNHHTRFVSLGMPVRRLTLGSHVGLIQAEFNMLPKHCPYLEYVDFNPRLWRYLAYTERLKNWQYLARYPVMTQTRFAVPLLRTMGHVLTHIEFDSAIIDELAKAHFLITSILIHTPNLISLRLDNKMGTSQGNMSISDFEFIHTLCPYLESLAIEGMDGLTVTSDTYSINFSALSTATHLKSLSLDMAINSDELLVYWAHKYPWIENLDIHLRLLEPEYYHEAVQPENSRMKESFAMMATRFSKLKKIKARFDEKFLPCDVLLRGLSDTAHMQDISIHFYNFDYHRRSARHFKLLITRSIASITCIRLSNWDRSWDYETDLLQPMSQCSRLQQLSLSPQPGTLTEFDIDVLLDFFPQLKQLELANTYNLFVRNNRSISNRHGLETLSLRHTMVNNRLFDYLAARCSYLHTLDISHVTKPYDNTIQVQINMPSHRLRSVRIEKLQLGLRLEDSGFQCNHYATLCSVEESLKTERLKSRHSSSSSPEKWYHVYQSKEGSRILPKTRLQKLNDKDIERIKQLKITKQLWEQISFVGSRIKCEDRKRWHFDIPYGYFSVRCKSVDEFIFEGIPL